MKKLFLLIAVAGFSYGVQAGGNDTIVSLPKPVATAPAIDGVGDDDCWADLTTSPKHQVDRVFKNDTIAEASDCSGYFQVAFDASNIYVLVSVVDNINYPEATGNDFGAAWEKDKVEIYFDTKTSNLKDGKGASSGNNGAGPDHAQLVANGIVLDNITWGAASSYSEKLTGANRLVEFQVAWSDIPGTAEGAFDPMKAGIFGFDVTIADNDGPTAKHPARRRLCWMNAGAVDENWNNMDGAGYVESKGNSAVSTQSVENFNIVVVNNVVILKKAANVSIINLAGQQVKSVTNASQVNVSDLSSGVYFVKAGNQTAKFIKR